MVTLTATLGRLSRRTRRRKFGCPFVTVAGDSFSCFGGRSPTSRSRNVTNPLSCTTANPLPLNSHPLLSVPMSSPPPPPSLQKKPPLLGGEHAGFLAEFSPIDGRLLPVPHRLVPDELLMWGQAPECWEVLISEDLTLDDPCTNNNSSNGKGGIGSFRRRTIKVLPGVGCGLDSLETLRSEEIFDGNVDGNGRNGSNSKTTILDLWHDVMDGTAAIDTLLHTRIMGRNEANGDGKPPTTATTKEDIRPKSTRKISAVTEKTLRLETLFSLPQCEDEHRHRLRVSLDISVAQQHPDLDENDSSDRHTQTGESSYRYEFSRSHPIRVSMERCCDHARDPSLGALSSSVHNDLNGHLDAGTVSDLIGKVPRIWKDVVARVPQHLRQQDHHDAKQKTDEEKFPQEALLELPGSISISSGTIESNDGWYIDVACSDGFPQSPEESQEDSRSQQVSHNPPSTNERLRSVRREFRGCSRTLVHPSQPTLV